MTATPHRPAAGSSAGGATYSAAGVDIAAGEAAVDLMKASVARTHRPEVLGGLGGFAGLFDASALRSYRRPLLATSTDGVGTKVDIARRLNIHGTIGRDLVGMVVDDLVVCGAEPLFMTDYVAVGRVVPERVAALVAGVADGCAEAGCALVGGETAEHPGLLGPDEFDIAGAATGVVEADALLGADRVRPGDVLVAMASSGLHSNGYSLARHVFFDRAGWSLDREVPEFGRSLGLELLEPTRIYARCCLGLVGAVPVHAFSHITGGGIAANLARVIPAGLTAVVERASWTPPAVFAVLAGLGAMARVEVERALNQGVGMIAVVPADAADGAVSWLNGQGLRSWIAGSVRAEAADAVSATESAHAVTGQDGGRAVLVGDHPAG